MKSEKQKTTNAKKKAPKPDLPAVIKLWARAGARCEFKGCNKYLLKDNLTLKEANFSHIAHIVARKLTGPRGNDKLPLKDRSKIENLILLCLKHHKLIDDKKQVKNYLKELLQKYKKDHEDRIFRLTKIQENYKTFIIRLKAKIAGEAVEIPFGQINNAVYPLYPMNDSGLEIDLSPLGDIENQAYWDTCKNTISDRISKFYLPGIKKKTIEHVSVFAIGPIPLLIYFGNQLSNVVKTNLYQRHKDTEDWSWKTDGKTVRYKIKKLTEGKNSSSVTLLLSLSGSIKQEDLPASVKNKYWIYEITLDGCQPNTLFMRKKEDLLAFKTKYHLFLRMIKKDHGGVKNILLFPAVPPPVAILCGRELIKKTDPSLIIYDFNKKKGGFNQILKVN